MNERIHAKNASFSLINSVYPGFGRRYVIAVRPFKRSKWQVLIGPVTEGRGELCEKDALEILREAKRTCYKARMRRVR